VFILKETVLIKCLTGQLLEDIKSKTTEELFQIFKKSYFHLWDGLFLDNEEAFKILKDDFNNNIKDYKVTLSPEKQWLLLNLLTQQIIAENFQLYLLLSNISESIENLEETDPETLLEDINIHQSIIQETGALNYVLKFTKYKEFGIEPTVECDSLPSIINNSFKIKEMIRLLIPKVDINDYFLSDRYGELYISKTTEEEAIDDIVNIIIFSFLNDLTDFLMENGLFEEDSSVNDEDLLLFTIESIKDTINSIMEITQDDL